MTNAQIPTWMQQGLALQRAGRLAEAEHIYRQVLAAEPNNPQATHFLGVLAARAGNYEAALAILNRSIELAPTVPAFHNNLGEALWETGQREQAEACWRRARSLSPNMPTTLLNLAKAREAAADPAAAEPHYARVLELQPGNLFAAFSLARIWLARGQANEALALWDSLVKAAPTNVHVLRGAGISLAMGGRLNEALAHLEQALALAPGQRKFHEYRAMALLEQGRIKEAFAEFNWEAGTGDGIHQYGKPVWDGSPLQGRTILLVTRRNPPDAIQLARFAPLVARAGGRVLLQCHAALVGLFKSMKNVEPVASSDPPPPCDVVCDLARVPALLDLTPADLSGPAYLTPYRAAYDVFRNDLAALGPARKIGLVWAGEAFAGTEAPAVPLAALAPLLRRQDLVFFTLQMNGYRNEIAKVPEAARMLDWTGRIQDLADAAAFVAALDLLISADTPLAHVGGAMGRRVWTLLDPDPTWNWLFNRDRTLWYPKMRLFRRPPAGDWAPIVERMNKSLAS